MSDMTKCKDSLCPSKEKCYRYASPVDDQWQSYDSFNREADADNCIAFLDYAKCAYCNLENGNHKLSCQVIKVTMLL